MPFINIEKISWQFADIETSETVIETLKSCKWEVVKTNPKRSVYKVGAYFAKIYSFAGLTGLIKKHLSNGARKEWLISNRLLKSFKEIVQPVAFGASSKISIFVTRSAEPCLTAADFCLNNWHRLSNKERCGITNRFAGFILRMLQSGLFQKDFNLGNILISTDHSKFYAVDLQYAQILEHSPTEQEIARNLSCLMPPFQIIENRFQIRFFLYLTNAYPKLKDYFYYIQDMAFARMRKQWLKKNPRKLKEHSIISNLICTPFARGFINRDLDSRLKDMLIKTPAFLFKYAVKDYKKNDDIQISIINWQGKKYIFKRKTIKNRSSISRCKILNSSAWKIWKKTHLISARNISTPMLFAVIDTNKKSSYQSTFILNEYLEGCDEIGKLFTAATLTYDKKKILENLADFFWYIHQRGVYIGNAGAESFLFINTKQNRIRIIDIESVRFKKNVSSRQRFSDLKDMAASLMGLYNNRQDVLYFFNAYLKKEHLGKINHKAWLKKM